MDGFRKFLLRGNVVDLAVAVVIGAAFGAIVTAFAGAFITPLIGLIAGKTGASRREPAAFRGRRRFPYGPFVDALIGLRDHRGRRVLPRRGTGAAADGPVFPGPEPSDRVEGVPGVPELRRPAGRAALRVLHGGAAGPHLTAVSATGRPTARAPGRRPRRRAAPRGSRRRARGPRLTTQCSGSLSLAFSSWWGTWGGTKTNDPGPASATA